VTYRRAWPWADQIPPLQISLGRLGGGERPVRKIYDASSPRELPQQLCLLAGEMRSASVASESLEQEPDAVLTNRSLTTCRVVRWRWTPACVPLRQARRERRPIARRLDQWRPSSACRAAGVKAVWFTLRPCSPHAPLVCGELECNARSAGASHPRGTCLCASSVAALYAALGSVISCCYFCEERSGRRSQATLRTRDTSSLDSWTWTNFFFLLHLFLYLYYIYLLHLL
jgi:hypothetical protein